MKGIYTDFAGIYDSLMYDVDYKKWADYIEDIFTTNGIKPSMLLDLGCGTGSFCLEMARRGYDMTGVDISTEMLSVAKLKAVDEGMDILYLNQDMTEFELYGTVDAIVCLMDSINYLLYKKDIRKLFSLVKNYLNPQGLFIFDVNSAYKLETVLGNEVFYDIGDDITYIWQNSYDKRKKVCRFDLTFFVKAGDSYGRHDEVHFERAYSADEMVKFIADSGMKLLGIYNEFSFSSPGKKSERIFFVCKKD